MWHTGAMSARVLGISGSPIVGGTTDRAVEAVLAASGLESEFIRLWDLDLHPCKACLACARTNVCTGFDDDWLGLAGSLVRADAVVLGGWLPFNIIDAATKMVMERAFSLRHSLLLLADAVAVAVVTGTVDPELGADSLLAYFETEGLEPLGKVVVAGTDPCWSCGLGEVCVQGGTLPLLNGYQVFKYPHLDRLPPLESFRITPDVLPPKLDEQTDSLAEAERLGLLIAERVEARAAQRLRALEAALPGAASLLPEKRVAALTEHFAAAGALRDEQLVRRLRRLAEAAERRSATGAGGKAVVSLLAFGRSLLLAPEAQVDAGARDLLVVEARRAVRACYDL